MPVADAAGGTIGETAAVAAPSTMAAGRAAARRVAQQVAELVTASRLTPLVEWADRCQPVAVKSRRHLPPQTVVPSSGSGLHVLAVGGPTVYATLIGSGCGTIAPHPLFLARANATEFVGRGGEHLRHRAWGLLPAGSKAVRLWSAKRAL